MQQFALGYLISISWLVAHGLILEGLVTVLVNIYAWTTPILPKMVIALDLQLTDLESVHEEM